MRIRQAMLIGIVFILTLTGLGVAAEPGVQVEQQGLTEGSSAPVILGDAQFDAYVPLLEGKRVALFSNHTGIVGDETSGIGELPEGVDASLIHFGLDAEGNAITYGLHIQLYPGSKLFVYTDGVAEATNAEKELFGTDRMIEALNVDPNAAPQDILRNVRVSVDSFVKDAEQFDDLTMLCVEYKEDKAQ